MSPPVRKTLRCAIYTRKSSEDGLDQAFNSLHAQREACEAYVKSQAGEGWSLLKTAYDDGGFSGGTIDRPGLKALLAQVEARKIEVVVVYKVDRLTRSLADFAKIVERFDAAGVSFVSVTQAFNTTTSMGRLTLNVLLSFAQFEREVTGERIRDKIAASKAKGMWMGGVPPLGYDKPTDPATRALVVNLAEAATVRGVFRAYLDARSVGDLRDRLEGLGVRSKVWITAKGKVVGGEVFSTGALLHLLKNRVYLGDITHKGQSFAGSHPAVVDVDLFDAVQAKLRGRAITRGERVTRASDAVLKGKIYDANGAQMSPSFGYGRGGKVYRYYVSASVIRARAPAQDDIVRRVPGPALDVLVTTAMKRLTEKADVDLLERIDIQIDGLVLTLRPEAVPSRDSESRLAMLRRRLEPGERVWDCDGEDGTIRIWLPVRAQFRGGRTWLIGGQTTPTPRRVKVALLKGLREAHTLARQLREGRAFDQRYERNLARLSFLSPAIQKAIVEGRQPPGLTLMTLINADLPLAWADQEAALGF